MNIPQIKPIANKLPIVHLVRHGRIPNYETDQPLTAEGRQEALAVGRGLAGHIRPGETISFFSSPTRRTRQTAALLRDGLNEAILQKNVSVTINPITAVDDGLQNLQFYLGEFSYDPIHPLFEVARWRLQQTPSPQNQACATFHTEFWSSPDPMDYWLTHPSEAAESPEAVARRIHAYLAKRLTNAAKNNNPRREFCVRNICARSICVAHSANLRAFLKMIFGSDPGEPPFCGMVTVNDGQVYYQEKAGGF